LINQQNGLAKAKAFEHAQQNVNLTAPQHDAWGGEIRPPAQLAASLEMWGYATAARRVHIWKTGPVGVRFAPAIGNRERTCRQCPN
jgi:hypothetical protein